MRGRRFINLMGASLQSGGPVYDPAAVALFAAMTTQPTAARKLLINGLIVSLKTSGAWALLDIMYVMAAADSQAARLNWKNPGSFTLSPVNAPAFQADRGFTGDGATSILNTGWAANPNGVNFTQNNNSSWLWSRTDGQFAPVDAGRAGGAGQYNVRAWDSTLGNQRGAASDGGDAGNAQTSGVGFFGTVRVGAAQKQYWKNGAKVGADLVTASAAPSVGVAWVCGANSTSFSVRQQSAAAFGASIPGLEAATYAGFLTYMQAVGAA